jgi:ribonuclease P protein component
LWQRAAGARAVVVVAGRRLGGSVVRNRARRRLREAYRHEKDRLPGAGVRLGLIARRGALELPLSVLRRDVAGALGQVGRALGA